MNEVQGLRRARFSWRPHISRDPVDLALLVVFVLAAAFYLWTAGTSSPLALTGHDAEAYNRLADAFLHFRFSVGDAPAGLLQLADPFDPVANEPFRATGIHDLALYDGRLYVTWGPTVAALLVPLRLLGLAPSSSLVAAVLAIGGLGFALATLRAILRQIGTTSAWLAAFAALALACSTAIPFILRRPASYEVAIAGGFFFAAVAIWLVVTALIAGRASTWRLVAISACLGLAVCSRPPLAPLVLLLVLVFIRLRSTASTRTLVLALGAPVATIGVLLLAYNALRFGSPLEPGQSYQLAGYNPKRDLYGDPGYVLPGLWFYLLSPPRPTVLFPFLQLTPQPLSYPGTLPPEYFAVEVTGGLLPMAPILIFLPLLLVRRLRRSAPLAPLRPALAIMVGAGALALLFFAYEFFGTTQRYEVDFAPVFLIGALTAWLTLATTAAGARRRLLRIGGAVLIAWGALAGLAVSFTGYYNPLPTTHPETWENLENAGSPVSTAIAMTAGRPILATVKAPNLSRLTPITYSSLGAGVNAFALAGTDTAELTIVSPSERDAGLVLVTQPGPALPTGAAVHLTVRGPGDERVTYRLQPGSARLPLRLQRGLNRLSLDVRESAARRADPADPAANIVVTVNPLTLAYND